MPPRAVSLGADGGVISGHTFAAPERSTLDNFVEFRARHAVPLSQVGKHEKLVVLLWDQLDPDVPIELRMACGLHVSFPYRPIRSSSDKHSLRQSLDTEPYLACAEASCPLTLGDSIVWTSGMNAPRQYEFESVPHPMNGKLISWCPISIG